MQISLTSMLHHFAAMRRPKSILKLSNLNTNKNHRKRCESRSCKGWSCLKPQSPQCSVRTISLDMLLGTASGSQLLFRP